jgi:hypothetical protein
MSKMSRRIQRRVEVDDIEAVGSMEIYKSIQEENKWYGSAYDARATSLPEGEIVADPTLRSTWIETSASNVVLSKADFIVFPFLDSSIILTAELSDHC